MNSEPGAAWSLCSISGQSEVGIMTRSCLKRSPSCDVSSCWIAQYGCTESGREFLSEGQPVSMMLWSSICSWSVAAAAWIFNIDQVMLEFQRHTLQAVRSRGKWACEDNLQGLVVCVYCDVALAKNWLIKFLKSMDNGKGLFLNFSIALFGWGKRTGAVCYWLPLDDG